ncbi:MAG: 16S rRNA (guanine(966)-N(2))-methyltransferase RsmD [Clostridia bacterium]|nr:16S rRNA (guanine(966)-N(2))-methyltransferase RsmD [Clostridia bacterium]
MRIITGQARNIQLQTLEGEATRPTAERVKEAVFSALQFELENASFLDLFSGSGQMGLEAVSRGAALAVMVDASPDAIAVMKANAKKTKLFDRCRIVNYRYQEYLKGFSKNGDKPFDIIYIDPPFTEHIHGEVMKRLALSGAADVRTKILVESEEPDIFAGEEAAAEKYEITKNVKYGRIYVTYLRLKADAGMEQG